MNPLPYDSMAHPSLPERRRSDSGYFKTDRASAVQRPDLGGAAQEVEDTIVNTLHEGSGIRLIGLDGPLRRLGFVLRRRDLCRSKESI